MGGGGGERMIKHMTLTGSINYAAFMENNLAILIEALNIFNSFGHNYTGTSKCGYKDMQ